MEYTTDQGDALVSHFLQIGNFIEAQQDDIWRNIRRVQAGRGRTAKYQRAIDEELNHLFFHAHGWADTGVTDAWEAGYRSIWGLDEAISLKGIQSKELGQLKEQYRQRLNQMERYTRKDTRRFLRDARQLSLDKVREGIDKGENVLDALGVRSFEHRREIAGSQRSVRRRLAPFGRDQTLTVQNRAFVLGQIHGADAKGIEFMEVSDGPQCGWTSHDDTEKANGKIVTVREAREHPIAHPNCVRQFVPRPDLNGSKKEDRKKLSTAQKAAAVAAGAAAAGLLSKALFQVTTEIVDQELAKNIAAAAVSLDRAYLGTFDRLRDTQLGRFHFPPKPETEQLELPLASGNGAARTFRMSVPGDEGPPFQPPVLHVVDGTGREISTIRGWQDDVVKWGNAIMDKRVSLDVVPEWVKKSLHIVDIDPKEGPTNQVAAAIYNFNRWVHAKRVTEKGVEAGAQIINFQAKRRNWNEFFLWRNHEQLASALSATWTKYGPRTRIDLTDFMRGRITLTKTGVRRSITLNPKGNLRSMLALSQDGTLMGAVRLVPNRIFRAIIETDEFGKLSGNVRLVPNGPFKVILRFETPRPKNWKYQGLVPGEDFVDLSHRAREARGFGLDDFTFRNVYETLHELQLRDIVFETNIFKKTFYQIHTEFKIPIPQLRDTLERLIAAKKIRREGGTAALAESLTGYTGTLTWRPSREQLRDFQKAMGITNLKVLGEVKFSSLKNGFASILPDIKSAAYFRGLEFQQVLTSMKASGLDIVKRMTNFQYMELFDIPLQYYDQVREAVEETEAALVMFLRKNQRPELKIGNYTIWHKGPLFGRSVLQPEALHEYFEGRFAQLIKKYGEEGLGNRADIYKGVLAAVRGVANDNLTQLARQRHRMIPGGRTHREWLKILAGVDDTDGRFQIERKIDDLVRYLRVTAMDSGEVHDLLNEIDPLTINLAARSMVKKGVRALRVPAEKILGSNWEGLFRRIVAPMDIFLRLNRDWIPTQFLDEWNKFIWAWEHAKQNESNLASFGDLRQEHWDGILAKARAMQGPIDSADPAGLRNALKATDDQLIKLGLDLRGLRAPKGSPGIQLREDIIRSWWGYKHYFPDMAPVKFKVPSFRTFVEEIPDASALAFYKAENATVYIHPAVAAYWDSPIVDTIMKMASETDFFTSSGLRGPIHLVAHELGHHLHISFGEVNVDGNIIEVEEVSWLNQQVRDHFLTEVKARSFKKFGIPWEDLGQDEQSILGQELVIEQLSEYGGTNEYEAYAEALAGWLLNNNTERLSKIFKEFMEASYRDPSVRVHVRHGFRDVFV